jgi:hypothetical protein
MRLAREFPQHVLGLLRMARLSEDMALGHNGGVGPDRQHSRGGGRGCLCSRYPLHILVGFFIGKAQLIDIGCHDFKGETE